MEEVINSPTKYFAAHAKLRLEPLFRLKSTMNRQPVFYSPDLESDLLPSELHSFDFEINSYKANMRVNINIPLSSHL